MVVILVYFKYIKRFEDTAIPLAYFSPVLRFM